MNTYTMTLRNGVALTIERVFGAWIISAVVGGFRQSQTYFGYTRLDAIKCFRQFIGK